MFTYELARRLEGSNITANCLHPGMVKTNFGKELKGVAGFLFGKMTGLLRTAEKGAETIIWLVSSKDIEGVSGKYFKDKKEIKSTKLSYDTGVQQKLWEVSNKLCGLK
jgi:NAD(P)-dependent dehydrogenase (short-subunit alcohol dehydrogenase family)